MTAYEPTSRRPIAGMFRSTARALVEVAVRAGIHPDVFSYASILVAGIAGVLFWQSTRHPKFLILGVAFAFLRLWLNMFDGMAGPEKPRSAARSSTTFPTASRTW